jgi:hypothetical protein
MKKGKTSKIQGFKDTKVIYGTVDSINFKSLYLNIQTWVEPITSSENWQRIVLNLSREIKHTIYEHLNKKYFDEKFIVDLDLRSSGLSEGKKSFMSMEATFYLNTDTLDFKSKQLKDDLKKLTSTIIKENLDNNEYFDFFLRKTKKEVIN